MDDASASSILSPGDLANSEFRPIYPTERKQWDSLIREHHHRSLGWIAGESLRHVVLKYGEWGAASYRNTFRNRFIGCSQEQALSRLISLANNVRYLILPAGRIKHLASRVPGLSVKCLSPDWQRIHAHPLHAVQTFLDPARFAGTCYKAAGWICPGETRGFGRSGRLYYEHGRKKLIFLRVLQKNARTHFCGQDNNPKPTGEPRMSVTIDALPPPRESGTFGIVWPLFRIPA